MNYQHLTEIINTHITAFNQHLAGQSAIPLLEWGSPHCFMHIAATPWEEQFWPNKDSRGVYFLYLRDPSDSDNVALYVGLASLANIGTRLDSHLNQSDFRKTGIYKDYDSAGKEFIIDWVGTIALTDRGLAFLAPSLEEYLISRLSKELRLTNKKGIHI
jgi:hypothetical protein